MVGVDVIVIGGGIAGVSAASFVAGTGASVTLLERENALSVHTTGRSAAIYLANYGLAQTRRLTLASRAFLERPPEGFADAPLVLPRGMLSVGGEADVAALRQLADAGRLLDPTITEVTAEEVRRLCPVLRPERSVGGVLEPGAADLDVAGLHGGFVRLLERQGGAVHRSSPVTAIERTATGWLLTAGGVTVGCDRIVDAAGAWGDEVAALAGVAPVGLRPLRRTALTVGLPDGVDARRWPAVSEVHHTWYFRPEGDGLLISPADETPSPPCDARPEYLDVALAMERVGAATTLPMRSVRRAWAGLRTFAPDGEMVIGPDPADPTWVWCVGQGGYGIQSAPAVGRLTADLVTGNDHGWVDGVGVDVDALAPDRLRGIPRPESVEAAAWRPSSR
jgi:D-arginine dehydrogenase